MSARQQHSSDEKVITPGGPRLRSHIIEVQPGTVVRADEGGVTVLPPDTAADYVITPGGPRKRSLIHKIEPGQMVRVDEGNWYILDKTEKIIRDITPEPPVEHAPGFGQGWITFAAWNNNTASAISLLRTTWTVPPPPRNQDGQLIYLFNGVQTNVVSSDPNKAGLHILQPVLQWGESPDGGGNSWAIASWFVGNQNQPSVQTPLVSVNPGAVLTGVITLTGGAGNLLTYTCQFQGISQSLLTVQMPAPFQCVHTLEAYNIMQSTDYPNALRTPMTNITVQTGNTSPTLSWTPNDAVTDCGQYTVVVSNATPGGEVDLFYGYTLDLVGKVILADTTPEPPTLASQNGMLFLGWKGAGNDNLNVMLSADNGITFGRKITSPETSDLAPCLCAHHDLLIIAWKGSGNDNMNVAQVPLSPNGLTYDIQQFANKRILSDTSSDRPAICSHNGLLFLAWKGSGNENLNVMVSNDNGQNFSGKMTSPETSDSVPALASHNGKLMIAWKGSGNDQLNVAEVPVVPDPNHPGQVIVQQFRNKVILSDSSSTGPALTSFAELLFLSWKGSNNDDLNAMVSKDDGITFQGKCIFGDTSDHAPALASHNGQLMLSWKGSGNENMNVAQISLDGDLTMLPWAEELACEEGLAGRSGAVAVAHQDPINQFDVLGVTQTGQVGVSWVTGEQQWNGPAILTPNGFAMVKGNVALAHQTSMHQLDLLTINNQGAVSVMWVTDGGRWAGPVNLTGPNVAPPGGAIALAHQTALNQLDALFIDRVGAVNVMWVVEEGIWQGPVRLTTPEAAPPGGAIALAHQTSSFQLDAMFVDNTGAVAVMWVVGESAWQGPVRLTGPNVGRPGGYIALAHQSDMNQLDALFVDSSGALCVMWVVGEGKWQGPVHLTSPGFALAGGSLSAAHQTNMRQLDVMLVDNTGSVVVMWVVDEGGWQGPARLTGQRFSSPGAPIALGHQTSMRQLDAIVTDASGTLNVMWVVAEGVWQGPVRLPGPFII
jgi:hypothetical protein